MDSHQWMMPLLGTMGLLLLAGGAAHAAAPGQSGPVHIYVNGVAPFAYHEQGSYRGLLYDMLAALRARMGGDYLIRPVPLRRAQVMLETEPEALATLARFAETEHRYRWLCKLADDQLVLVTRAGATHDINSLAAARHLRVGVLLGGPAESAARHAGLQKIETVSSAASNARKLASGRIDAWLTARSIAQFEQRGIGGKVEDLRIGPGVQTVSQYLAAPRGMADHEAQKWQNACNALHDNGAFDRIAQNYGQQRSYASCGELNRACPRPDRQAAPQPVAALASVAATTTARGLLDRRAKPRT
ncbi:transporter substrate-binding domain-containing protein [Pseudoduganella sp. FT55W]|uniref:Transporter substrate-binding domain-containing protein n=1 Tax=Duganella rivi TaxID=2666083 RepID=A0A7X4GV48_9BURK|nr:transporter substrate-binding domain-containing protein [Duganella rivi]